MANFLITLIPLLASLAATARSQTSSFYYDFYGTKPSDLTYQGDAHFPSDTTYLRLTKTDDSGQPAKSSAGRAVHTNPIQFWQSGAQVDLETTIKFLIRQVDNDPADGIAFFIAPIGTTIGSTGNSFGVYDSNGKKPGVFSVQFDIYANKDKGDPDGRHIGIDIESSNSVNTTIVGDAIVGQEVTALIGYKKATKMITVKVTAGGKTFEVSYEKDLSTILDQQVQVGLSAATGGQVAFHEIISWYFTATLVYTGAEEDVKIRQFV
uniref:Lectin 1 n=1 Tax=Ocimum basilicum TaxID=39350 RepID=A0A219KUW4_OCIBA|nr:lectin 1 [Ocimum basilicum]